MANGIKVTGAVIDGEYRCYTLPECDLRGVFTYEGQLYDQNRHGHPTFDLEMDEEIQLEFDGHLEPKRTVEEYIIILSRETNEFVSTL